MHSQAGIRSYLHFNKLSLCWGLRAPLSLGDPRAPEGFFLRQGGPLLGGLCARCIKNLQILWSCHHGNSGREDGPQLILGASCPSIQTGQPRTVCSDLSSVNSVRLSSLLLMNGQIILMVPRAAVTWAQQPPSPPHQISHISHMRTLFLLTYQPLPFHNDLPMAGLAGAGLSVLTMASTTTLSLFSGL